MVENGAKLREDLKMLVTESPMDFVDYKADIILPPLAVKQNAASIGVLPTSAGMKKLDNAKANRGSFKRTEYIWGKDSYTTSHKGYEVAIDNTEAMENSDIFDEETTVARNLYSEMRITREARVASAVMNTTTFTGSTNVQAAAAVYSNASAATPFVDFDNAYVKIKAKAGIPKKALSGILAEAAFRKLVRTNEVLTNIKYTTAPELMSMEQQIQMIANYLGLKNIIVTDGVYDNTAELVKDAVFADIWNPQLAMLALISPAAPTWDAPGLGRQPRWSKFAKDFRVESYGEVQTDSRVVRVREYSGEKINTKFACLITGVMS